MPLTAALPNDLLKRTPQTLARGLESVVEIVGLVG
jgi:hypothetical protein